MKLTYVLSFSLVLFAGQIGAHDAPIMDIPQADISGLTLESLDGVQPALSVNDAPCAILVDHFDVSSAWISALVIRNLSVRNSNQVSILALPNDPVDPLSGALRVTATSNVSLKAFEKQARQLTFNGENNTIPTGTTTGTLLILSERALTGFVLYGNQGTNVFDSLASTGSLFSGNWIGTCRI